MARKPAAPADQEPEIAAQDPETPALEPVAESAPADQEPDMVECVITNWPYMTAGTQCWHSPTVAADLAAKGYVEIVKPAEPDAEPDVDAG